MNPGLDRDELRRTGSESSLVLMFCVHVGSFIQLLLPKVGQAMEWQDSAFGRMANLLLKRLKEGKSLWPVLRFKQRATSKILSVSARSGKNQILKKRVHFAIALADLATAGETIRV
ncbi:hypothetical protein HYX70_04930 [Candidatus Saccharibacteria bacterium]|nr:hypothetical protein [Candidatus Saccharibacteria bacterium]